MKITDYENEEALDLLADLIDPAAEIFSDKKLREMLAGNAPKIKVVQHIIRENKKSLVEIFARIENVPVAEYHANIIKMTKDLLELFNDKELVGFFISQEPKKETKSYGSAMGSIEAGEA